MEGPGVWSCVRVLAKRIVPELESAGEPPLDHDSSTNTLIRRYRQFRIES